MGVCGTKSISKNPDLENSKQFSSKNKNMSNTKKAPGSKYLDIPNRNNNKKRSSILFQEGKEVNKNYVKQNFKELKEIHPGNSNITLVNHGMILLGKSPTTFNYERIRVYNKKCLGVEEKRKFLSILNSIKEMVRKILYKH